MEAVPQPSYPHFRNVAYPRSMVYSVSDFIDDLRVYPVKHTGKDGFARLPYDSKNCSSNEKTDHRVSQGIAQPDSNSTKEHGQTGETVYSGMMTIGDKSGAADFLTNFYAKLGYCLIADKPDHRRNYYSPQILHDLRMKEAIYGLIARNDRAKQNHEYDSYAREVFYTTVTVSKPLSGFPACKPKSNPQGDSRGSVANIMNRIGEKRHTSGKHDDDDLKDGGSEQSDERPFHRPDSSLRGKKGWIDGAMCMDMGILSMVMFMMVAVLMRISMINHI